MSTGNELLASCSDREDDAKFWLCLGYIAGVQGATAFYVYSSVLNEPYCMPSGATNGQVRDVIVAFLRAHPDKRHHHSSSLIYAALTEAFPCPAK